MAAGWPSTSLDLCAPLQVSGLPMPFAPDTRDSTTANMLIVYTPSFSFLNRRGITPKEKEEDIFQPFSESDISVPPSLASFIFYFFFHLF